MELEFNSNPDMEKLAKNMCEWVVHVVSQDEQRDSKLKRLKEEVNAASENVRNATEELLPELLKLQTVAINNLVSHVSSK